MAIVLHMGLLIMAARVVSGAACLGKTCGSPRNSGTLLVQTRVKASLGANDEPLEALPTADINRSLGASSESAAISRTKGSFEFASAGVEADESSAKLQNAPLREDANSKSSAASEQPDNMTAKPVLETSHADNTQEQPDARFSKQVQSDPSSRNSTSNMHAIEKAIDNLSSKQAENELRHADNSPVASAADTLGDNLTSKPVQSVLSHASGGSKTTTGSMQKDAPVNPVRSASKFHSRHHSLARNTQSQAPGQHLQQLADIFNRAVEIAERAENKMPQQTNSTHAANHSNISTAEEQADNFSAKPAQDGTQHADGNPKIAAKDEAPSTSSNPVQNATRQAGGSSSISTAGKRTDENVSDEPVQNQLPHAENKSSMTVAKERADDLSSKPAQITPSPADGSSNSRSASKQTNEVTAKPAQNKLPHTEGPSGLNPTNEHADNFSGKPVQNELPLAEASLNSTAKDGFSNVSAEAVQSEIPQAVGNSSNSASKQTKKVTAKPAQSERPHAEDNSSMNPAWEQADYKPTQAVQKEFQATDGVSNIMPLSDAEGRSNVTTTREQAIESAMPVQNTSDSNENHSIYQEGNMNRMSDAGQGNHGLAESVSAPLDVTQDEAAGKARAMLNRSEKEKLESRAPASGPGGDETSASLKHINELAKASVKAAADAMAKKSVEAAAGSREARKRAEQEETQQEDQSKQAAKGAEAAQRELEAAKGRLQAASEKRLNTTLRAASDEAEVKRHMAEGALQAAITTATSALKAVEDTKKAYSEMPDVDKRAHRHATNHACETSAPVHAWSWLSGAVQPGTPCLFGVDPRDEGESQQNGWCYTDAAAGVWPSWGPCADSCDLAPTFPSNSSASKEDDDPREVKKNLLEQLRQKLQALMAHLYFLESS